MHKTVFLTGSAGYLGGSLAETLIERNYDVLGLVRNEARADALARAGCEPVLGDLDDVAVLRAAARRADAVINAADSDHRGAVEVLLDALAGTGKPLLHTSGSSIVGDDARGEHSDTVFTEADVAPGASWRPDAAKAQRVAIDRLVLDGARRGIRTAVLCNTLIYGHGHGRSRDSAQLPRLRDLALRTGTARHVGPGRNVWSSVHLDDAIDLYLLALEKAPAGAFYFVESGEADFKAMTQAIADAAGLGPAQSIDIDGAIAEWGYATAVYSLGSNSRVRGRRARTELGWAPTRAPVLDWITDEFLAPTG